MMFLIYNNLLLLVNKKANKIYKKITHILAVLIEEFRSLRESKREYNIKKTNNK